MAKLARVQLQPVPSEQQSRPKRHLTALPTIRGLAGDAKSLKSTMTLVVVAITAVIGIFATQLWLSVSISEGAYITNDLILEERELARTERVMEQEVFLLSSPQNLAEKAVKQGMVQNAQPAFLTLAAGTIEGQLDQSHATPRANTIENAALNAYVSPPEPIKPVSASTTNKETAAAKPKETATPAPVKPSGPVAWSGNLPAPTTH